MARASPNAGEPAASNPRPPHPLEQYFGVKGIHTTLSQRLFGVAMGGMAMTGIWLIQLGTGGDAHQWAFASALASILLLPLALTIRQHEAKRDV